MICSFTMKVINMKFNLKIMKNFKSDINNTDYKSWNSAKLKLPISNGDIVF